MLSTPEKQGLELCSPKPRGHWPSGGKGGTLKSGRSPPLRSALKLTRAEESGIGRMHPESRLDFDPRLDAAIARYLDSTTLFNLDDVIAFGRPALHRVLELYYRGREEDVAPLHPQPKVEGRDAVDAWWGLVAGVGRAFLNEFLDYVEGKGSIEQDPGSYVAMLTGVDGTRARDILARYANHPDWLVRSHAIKGLQWRNDDVSIRIVEEHVEDSNKSVRLNALLGVGRRDPERSRRLLTDMIRDPTTPPLLRQQAEQLFSQLA